jgi:hypothetical protein
MIMGVRHGPWALSTHAIHAAICEPLGISGGQHQETTMKNALSILIATVSFAAMLRAVAAQSQTTTRAERTELGKTTKGVRTRNAVRNTAIPPPRERGPHMGSRGGAGAAKHSCERASWRDVSHWPVSYRDVSNPVVRLAMFRRGTCRLSGIGVI